MTAVTGPGAVSAVLPGVPESVGAARALARGALAGYDQAEAAVLAVSELVTNAICYTRSGLPGGTFAVSVTATDDEVLVRVTDTGGRGAPALLSPADADTEHGRGLLIVDAIAESWGYSPADAGRVTWCRIAGSYAGVPTHSGTRARARARERSTP